MKSGKMAIYEIGADSKETEYGAERIKEEKDTPAALFKKMRKLGSGDYFHFYGPEPERFAQQAKLMERYTDDYQGNVTFEQRYPSYDQMSDPQLRTYFTWRTKVRNGIVEESCLSFVYLHACELINNIGVENSQDGMAKLIFLWKKYARFSHYIERSLARWVKDYYICNDFDVPFSEIILKAGLEAHYPTLFFGEDPEAYAFDKISRISDYKFEGSKFYTWKNEKLMSDCLHETMENLMPFLDIYGMNWTDIIIGAMENQPEWEPFKGAVYADVARIRKTATISPYENYTFEKGSWTAYRPAGSTVAAGMVFGYIIKKLEAKLRIALGHKHKLNPKKEAMVESLRKTYGAVKYLDVMISDPLFDEIIDDTADACFPCKTEPGRISEQLQHEFAKAPYPWLREMRTARNMESALAPAKLFCRQAKILCDIEDDIQDIVPFDGAMPTYADMTNGQLRCYFTWRAKARQGEFYTVPEAYLRLYFFELINNIEGLDQLDSMKKMADVLLHYPNMTKTTERAICNWLKDYYVCGNFTEQFYSILQECEIEAYYPNVALEFEDKFNFEIYSRISGYKIEKSKFYTEKTQEMIKNCLEQVIAAVSEYFSGRGLDFKEIMTGKGCVANWWQPFGQAIYDRNTPLQEGEIILCANESYTYKHGIWSHVMFPEKDGVRTHLVGYIIKRMEVKLREITKYKHKLSAEIFTVISKLPYNDGKLKGLLKSPLFEQTIDNAVLAYLKENHLREMEHPRGFFEKSAPLPELKIDRTQFEKIREEASITREKLAIDEVALVRIGTDEIAEERASVIWAGACIDDEKEGEQKDEGNSWQKLYSALSQIQAEAVRLLLREHGADEFAQLAKSNKILQEVLLEAINDAALEQIGDNIIEVAADVPYIYEEYFEGLKDAFWRN